jgi:serine/threonine-protein kinase
VLAKAQSGLVFKATDFKHDRAVALKVLWPEFSRDEDEIRRFVRAMKTMMPLRHPNLVSLYGAGKTGPYCWIAMELVEGESLTQVIARLGTAGMLDWKKALRIAVYLGRALEYLHSQNVIHRNILPTNVLIGREPQETKLGDLVLAKATEGALAQQITKPGAILGDVRYMAPERTRGGAAAADGRSDLYSLGGLMYALLSGRAPLEGKTLIETLTKINNEVPVRPKKYQLAIPDAFESVVVRLLSKKPEQRHASATDLLRELDKLARAHSIPL